MKSKCCTNYSMWTIALVLFAALFLLAPVRCAFATTGELQAGGAAEKSASVEKTAVAGVSTQASTSNVRYVAVLGADTWRAGSAGPYTTWKNGSGEYHTPASDMTALARIDLKTGTVSVLTLPRDTEYSKVRTVFKNAQNLKGNQAFKYGFESVVKKDKNGAWTNYDTAMKAGGRAACQMISHVTGLKVTSYVIVDLYSFQNIVKKLGGVNVNIPVPIKDYRLYSNGQFYTVNKGKTGLAKLNSWDAMIASRARKPYHTVSQKTGQRQHYYTSLSQYKGKYARLLLEHTNPHYYYFSDDSIRQFLDRRMLASMVNVGLSRSEGAASFVWNQLIAKKLIWTNLKKSDVVTMANKLSKAKKSNRFIMYGASILDPVSEIKCYDNGVEQYLIPMDASNTKHGLSAYWQKKAVEYARQNTKQIKAVMSQFKAGKPLTQGWGEETIIGVAVGSRVKYKGVTYKVINNASLRVVKAPNTKNVVIPAGIKLNGKTYTVVSTAAKAFTGKKIRAVLFGANLEKIAPNTFKGSKATKIVLKTTKLTKAKLKNSLKGSKVKSVVVKVPKAQKKATLKKYKKYFSKKNAGWTVKKFKVTSA